MAYVKNTMIIRRELMARIVRMMKEDTLIEKIDRILVDFLPREVGPRRRCCVYKERAIVKYKLMPILGFAVGDEKDEMTRLSDYAIQALTRKKVHKRILTVVDEACTSCIQANYIVTDICKGCVASPCSMNCPKDAITFTNSGKAKIDTKKCISCGICKQVCPYHSIVYLPIPCEEVCPTNAISKDQFGIEQVDESKCIYCGKCINACPFGSIFEISHLIDIFQAIKKKKEVVAIVAPALFGQYKEPASKVFTAIQNIGFSKVVEVAEGATITTKNETEELKERLAAGQPFMTTSCCPSYTLMVNNHLPQLKPFVSHTYSPMYYTAQIVKESNPNAVIVFIGPCVAKRKEAQNFDTIDYVLTFEELEACFDGCDIKIDECEETELHEIPNVSRNYARSGGVLNSILAQPIDFEIKPFTINGLDKKAIGILKAAAKGKHPGNFIEVMACEGGCIAGPSNRCDFQEANKNMTLEMNRLEKGESNSEIG